MRRFTTSFAVVLFTLAGATSLQATTEYADLLIVELQTADEQSSSNEFVELFNPNADSLSLEGVSVQYRSAKGSTWQTKAVLSSMIPPRGRVVVTTYLDEGEHLGSGLANGGGFIRLINSDSEYEFDRIAWGSAVVDEPGMVAPAPGKQQSLKRMLNEDGGFIVDTVLGSFFLSEQPTPHTDNLPQEVEVMEDEPADDNSQDDTVDEEESIVDEEDDNVNLQEEENAADVPISYAPIRITELFIDPDKPLTDSDDEFIELYNPGQQSVNIENYVVETGSKFTYSFTLPAINLAPGQYLALFSIDTKLTLSNSAGAARILDPNGEVIFEVPSYEKAKPDTSWTVNGDGLWGWSGIQSPSAPQAEVLSATATEARKSAKAKNEKAAELSKKISTQGIVKATTGDSESEDARDVYEEPPEEESTMNTQLLAGMGSLTVLYAGYEYRTDITNRIHQVRRYFRGRRNTGANT